MFECNVFNFCAAAQMGIGTGRHRFQNRAGGPWAFVAGCSDIQAGAAYQTGDAREYCI